jgi:hypothetical protein
LWSAHFAGLLRNVGVSRMAQGCWSAAPVFGEQDLNGNIRLDRISFQ